eukprot:comp20616_c0_seq1/m.26629 comp20616_c0_seq1/g.26629  ORF comp20616_c0_seq1/g.26629 comp20616_c0_seq1/m.26629 type:complete len:553 (-) comp20616_c0_seq1:509-2167(-)
MFGRGNGASARASQGGARPSQNGTVASGEEEERRKRPAEENGVEGSETERRPKRKRGEKEEGKDNEGGAKGNQLGKAEEGQKGAEEQVEGSGKRQRKARQKDGKKAAATQAGDGQADTDTQAQAQSKPPPGSIDPDGPVGSMLNCTICFTQPDTEIYQCSNGHLLCADCHTRVVCSDTVVCPTCRVRMSRTAPSRNFVAEKARDNLPARCPHTDCAQWLTVATIKEHSERLCPHRATKCMYWRLGCGWEGKALDQQAHEDSCTYAAKTGKEVLAEVTQREENEEKRVQTEMQSQASQAKVLDLLVGRCRNIEVRDVRLEKDEIVGDISSTPFRALGHTWTATLRPIGPRPTREQRRAGQVPPPPGVGLLLRRSARGRGLGRMRLTVAILRGPALVLDLSPSVHSTVLARDVRTVPLMTLPMDPSQAAQLLACGHIPLRLVMADTRGGLDSTFTSLRNHEAVDGHQDDVGSESDDDQPPDSPHPSRRGSGRRLGFIIENSSESECDHSHDESEEEEDDEDGWVQREVAHSDEDYSGDDGEDGLLEFNSEGEVV